MKISIVCVGKLKEKYLKEAIAEYSKRLSKYTKLEIIEIPDEKITDNNSMDKIKVKEGENILKVLGFQKNQYIVALHPDSSQMDSEVFAHFLKDSMVQGFSHIYFIIGGTLGLSEEVLRRSHLKLSFSKMTFTHQLMRVILLEQVYRGFKIIGGEVYHR